MPRREALQRSELVLRQRLGHGLADSLCPNAELGDGRRLDQATAGRFRDPHHLQPVQHPGGHGCGPPQVPVTG